MKYVNGVLVKPTLSSGETWNAINILANAKQGDIYIRALHPLVSICLMQSQSICWQFK